MANTLQADTRLEELRKKYSTGKKPLGRVLETGVKTALNELFKFPGRAIGLQEKPEQLVKDPGQLVRDLSFGYPAIAVPRVIKNALIRNAKGEPFSIPKAVTEDRSLTELPGFNKFGAKLKTLQTKVSPPGIKQLLGKIPQDVFNQALDFETDIASIIATSGAINLIQKAPAALRVARANTVKDNIVRAVLKKSPQKSPQEVDAFAKKFVDSVVKATTPKQFGEFAKFTARTTGAGARGGALVPGKQDLVNAITRIKPQLKAEDLAKLSIPALTKMAQGLEVPAKAPAKKGIVGSLPEEGLVVANIGADGKMYVGGKGDLHFHLSMKYGDKIRKAAKLKSGEGTWKDEGYIDKEGKFLNRKEALKRVKVRPTTTPGELDAMDLREQVPPTKAPTVGKFIPPEKPPVVKPSLAKPSIAPPQKPPTDVVPQGRGDQEGKEFVQSYETQKDIWIGNKDVRILQSNIEKGGLQRELLTALGKPKYDAVAKDYDRAIQLYIDTKRNPEHLSKFYKDLTPEQKRITDLSQNLPPSIKATADKVEASYASIGLEAQEAEVIRNVLDNYVNRIWDLSEKQKTEVFRKFGTTTRHAKRRVLETILEGWSKDYQLKVEGATNNLQILKEEMVKTIEDKRFLKALQKIKTIDGEPLLTTKQLPEYTRVEHPNFKTWKHAGQVEEGKIYGKNVFIDDKGNIFERQELYAPKAQAKNLNNILGVSKLKGIKAIDAITKFNAVTKAWILQSSFFHHLAFMRSYWFGTNHKQWSEMSPRQAYRQGIRAIEEENPIVLLGVRNGLTLGLKQDWNEELLREEGIISKVLDKTKATKVVKDKVMQLRQAQADFLFGKFGAGLKAKSFLIEYRNMSKEHPDKSPDEIAKMVANLINDDFGGLHLQRLGRNPTVQHIFRLFALAPDWTESNVRTMVKAIGAGGKAETEFYRKFWAGILTKGAIITVLGNALMAGLDEDDRETLGFKQRMVRNYKRAWAEGKMRWLDVDITALYKLLGGKSGERKYFSIFGHFKDPMKFATHPIRSAHHKGSVIYKFFHEALSGVNWAGKRFTTAAEIAGRDFEKGLYKTTSKGKYAKGDPKFGRLKGQTVTWTPGKKGPLSYEQVPSFILSQMRGWQPIQIQNLLGWIAGEMEGFDALSKSMGLRVATTYSQGKEKVKTRLQELRDKYKGRSGAKNRLEELRGKYR